MKVFSPLYEKVLEGYKAADGVCPGVFLDRLDGDEGHEDVLVRAGFLLECAYAVVYLLGLGFGERVISLGVLDFAEDQEAVGAPAASISTFFIMYEEILLLVKNSKCWQ